MAVVKKVGGRLEGLVICIQAENALFHVPAEWLELSSKFMSLYRSFVPRVLKSAKWPELKQVDRPMFLQGVRAIELLAFLKVLDPRFEPYQWRFGSKELDGALKLAQRWGFGEIEKKCLRFSQDLGLPLSRQISKKAKLRKKAVKRAKKKAAAGRARAFEIIRDEEAEPTKFFVSINSDAFERSQAEYDLAFVVQDTFDVEDEKLMRILDNKEKARKRKWRSKAKFTDAYGYLD